MVAVRNSTTSCHYLGRPNIDAIHNLASIQNGLQCCLVYCNCLWIIKNDKASSTLIQSSCKFLVQNHLRQFLLHMIDRQFNQPAEILLQQSVIQGRELPVDNMSKGSSSSWDLKFLRIISKSFKERFEWVSATSFIASISLIHHYQRLKCCTRIFKRILTLQQVYVHKQKGTPTCEANQIHMIFSLSSITFSLSIFLLS